MKKNIYKFVIVATILLGMGLLGGFFGNEENVYAGVGENKLTGYAWSDNIGWISFSCANTGSCGSVEYDVSMDTNGNMSGYAWSDNIGWISFNSSDVGGCPSGSCLPKVTGNSMNGWIKAISADYNGWDGWISLRGTTPSYGITFDSETGVFDGYAWGSDVVGWIDWNAGTNGVVIDPGRSLPIIKLDAFPTAVNYNEMTKLFWNNKNVSSCWASGGPWIGNWAGANAVEKFVEGIGPITVDTEFGMTCSNAVGEESTGSVMITILPSDFSLQKSANIEINGVRGTSTPTTITILPQNNFNSKVSLRISSMSPELSGAGIRMNRGSLRPSGFGSGAEFFIIVSNPVPSGSYFVTIEGKSRGLTRTINVLLNVDNENIQFEEF